jgi:TRAP-type mannitol/chloroaromatic compound transport system permease small subunit
MSRIVRLLDSINELVGSSIAWLTFIMVLVTCLVVILRYIFNVGSIALQESVMYMHGIVFMLGIGYTLKHQGHVRVDIFYEKFSVRTKAIVDLLGTVFFLLPLGIFFLVGSLNYVSFSWSLHESSAQPGGLPGIFLVKTLIPLMAGLLIIQGLAEAGRSVIVILNKKT